VPVSVPTLGAVSRFIHLIGRRREARKRAAFGFGSKRLNDRQTFNLDRRARMLMKPSWPIAGLGDVRL
jgi:hypothetical protein